MQVVYTQTPWLCNQLRVLHSCCRDTFWLLYSQKNPADEKDQCMWESEDHLLCWLWLMQQLTIITLQCLKVLYKQTQAINLKGGVAFSASLPATMDHILLCFSASFSQVLEFWSLQFTNWQYGNALCLLLWCLLIMILAARQKMNMY